MAVCSHLLKMLCLLAYLQEYALKPISFNLSFSKLRSLCSQALVQIRSNCSGRLQIRDNGVLSKQFLWKNLLKTSLVLLAFKTAQFSTS